MDLHEWIVVAEGQGEGVEIRELLLGASLMNPVYLISRLDELFAYLEGKGIYGNRRKFPLPLMLLVSAGLICPDTGGHLRRMRACEGMATIPIILLVEDGEQKELDLAYEAGATSYLQKPFTFEALLERNRITGLQAALVRAGP